MRVADEYQYAVVQFLEQPYPNIDDYVCIPRSWIQTRRQTDRKCTVAFPDEDLSFSQKQIKDGERASETWKFYKAIIKFETHSYDAAIDFITKKNGPVLNTNKYSAEMGPNRKHSPVTVHTQTQTYSPVTVTGKNRWSKEIKYGIQSKVHRKKIRVAHKTSSKPAAYSNIENAAPATVNTCNNFSNRMSESAELQDEQLYQKYYNLYMQTSRNRSLAHPYPKKKPKSCNKTSVIDHRFVFLPVAIEGLGRGLDPTFLADNIKHLPGPLGDHQSLMNRHDKQSNLQAFCPGTQLHVTPVRQPLEAEQTSHQHFGTQPMELSTAANYIEQSDSENEASAVTPIGSQSDRPSTSSAGQPTADVAINNVSSSQGAGRGISPAVAEEVIAICESFGQAHQSIGSISHGPAVYVDKIATVFKKMLLDMTFTTNSVFDLYKTFARSTEVIGTMVNAIATLQKLFENKEHGVEPEVTSEVRKVGEETQAVKEKANWDQEMNEDTKKDSGPQPKKSGDDDDDDEEDNDDDNDADYEESSKVDDEDQDDEDDDDKDQETSGKNRGHIRSFVLPKDHDPNDTRWTLKHRKNDPKRNLVELMPKSKVYIDSLRLAHCKRTSKNSKTLGRMLLMEIFSLPALSVCSLTGARANAFDIGGKNIRPGLDHSARMTILSFVEDYSQQRNWGVFDTQSVVNSIRSKIQEIRAKHGQTA